MTWLRVKTLAASGAGHGPTPLFYQETDAILFHIPGEFVPFCNIGGAFVRINSAAVA